MELPPGNIVPYDITDDIDFLYPEDPYRLYADTDSLHVTDLETHRFQIDLCSISLVKIERFLTNHQLRNII